MIIAIQVAASVGTFLVFVITAAFALRQLRASTLSGFTEFDRSTYNDQPVHFFERYPRGSL